MNGRKVGRYELLERLGRGGMAEVYRAHQSSLDRFVAIKLLHPFLADDPEFTARFSREAQNIARLKQPNIVQVYDFETDPETETYYMVMELIDGPTLKDVLERLDALGERMDVHDALRITRDAASALAYAHSMNMIHRDVKPANLMLDGGHRVVLTDFGIARIMSAASTSATAMVGTPAYMAPEQGLGDAGDERSDLYSLGIILFQMVTGSLPYDGETPLSVVLKHLNEPIPSARDRNPDVPEAVDTLIQRLMAKDPGDRYQSATELISDIERVEAGLPPEPLSGVALRPAIWESATQEMVPVMARGTSASLDYSTLKLKAGMQPPLPPQALAEPKVPPRRRGSGLGCLVFVLFGILVVGLIVAWQWDHLPFAALLAPSPTYTPTLTATSSPTITSTPTASMTPSATLTPSATPTATLTPTVTPSLTITPTPTITLTPTVDVTQTMVQATLIMQLQTATVQACDYDYRVIEQDPPDGGYFLAGQEYRRQIRLLNTGTCPWERNTSLVFVSGESFNANPPYFFIRQRVNVGEEAVVEFVGRTPPTYGFRSGQWELRTPGQLLIGGEPISISINVYEGG
ncbi:MAG: protein kinase [Anaerolineae bacterium]